jgi:hypothetical protein
VLEIEPYIATGREPHHKDWHTFFQEQPEPPDENASAKVKMAYKLQSDIGQAIYRLRKCTVEPIIGIIKEILGFRQFSLRGLVAAAGEWLPGLSGLQLEAHAHPLHPTRALLARQWTEKSRAQEDDAYSIMPNSPDIQVFLDL